MYIQTLNQRIPVQNGYEEAAEAFATRIASSPAYKFVDENVLSSPRNFAIAAGVYIAASDGGTIAAMTKSALHHQYPIVGAALTYLALGLPKYPAIAGKILSNVQAAKNASVPL